jgi:hypothetical protein
MENNKSSLHPVYNKVKPASIILKMYKKGSIFLGLALALLL